MHCACILDTWKTISSASVQKLQYTSILIFACLKFVPSCLLAYTSRFNALRVGGRREHPGDEPQRPAKKIGTTQMDKHFKNHQKKRIGAAIRAKKLLPEKSLKIPPTTESSNPYKMATQNSLRNLSKSLHSLHSLKETSDLQVPRSRSNGVGLVSEDQLLRN